MLKDHFSSTKHVPRQRRSTGFTLVEMLVIAPLAIITVSVMIGAMVTMVGDSLIAQRSAASSYNLQDTLDRIEADARMSSAFLDRFALLPAGQGRNATVSSMTDTTSFESSIANASKSDLILNAPATTSNPFDANRRIVYYQDQPNPCGATAYLNRPLSTKIIYFTQDDGKGAGTKTLWRRTILPGWNTNSGSPDSQTICDTPWQRDSCPRILAPDCAKTDEKMLENVTNFQITYYTPAQTVETATTRNADSIKVNLTVQETVAGQTYTQSGTTVSQRTAGSNDEVPTTPIIYLDSPEDNMLNNPRKASFAWQSTAFGGLYTVSYSTNAGATWSTPVDVASNKFSVSVWPGDQVRLRVTAKNDMGSSPQALFSYTVPQWTYINLSGSWECYSTAQTTWVCPQYTMTKSGIVIFKGLAKNGEEGEMFVLPPEMRPLATHRQIFNSISNHRPSRIDINAGSTGSGQVIWGKVDPAATSAYVSLDNVRYPGNDSGVTWTNATLNSTNGWSHFGWQWGNVQYTKDLQNRTWLQGIACGANNIASSAQIMTLPANYQQSNTTSGMFSNTSTAGFSNVQLRPGASAQLQTRGLGGTGACFGGWMNFSFMYHTVTSTSTTISPTFATTWTDYSTSWNSLAAQKGGTGDNIVTLKGLVKDTAPPANNYTATETVATLPSGYRPKDQKLFFTTGYYYDAATATKKQGMARVDILPSGAINLVYIASYPPTGQWVSLEGIHFIADGT